LHSANIASGLGEFMMIDKLIQGANGAARDYWLRQSVKGASLVMTH
jgi:hypothetical protein